MGSWRSTGVSGGDINICVCGVTSAYRVLCVSGSQGNQRSRKRTYYHEMGVAMAVMRKRQILLISNRRISRVCTVVFDGFIRSTACYCCGMYVYIFRSWD